MSKLVVDLLMLLTFILEKIVGSMKYPLFPTVLPPVKRVAPSLFPCSIYERIFSNCFLSTYALYTRLLQPKNGESYILTLFQSKYNSWSVPQENSRICRTLGVSHEVRLT